MTEQRTAEEAERLINLFNRWQHAGMTHPYTCRNDSNHPVLVALMFENVLMIVCPLCSYTQPWREDDTQRMEYAQQLMDSEYGKMLAGLPHGEGE